MVERGVQQSDRRISSDATGQTKTQTRRTGAVVALVQTISEGICDMANDTDSVGFFAAEILAQNGAAAAAKNGADCQRRGAELCRAKSACASSGGALAARRNSPGRSRRSSTAEFDSDTAELLFHAKDRRSYRHPRRPAQRQGVARRFERRRSEAADCSQSVVPGGRRNFPRHVGRPCVGGQRRGRARL